MRPKNINISEKFCGSAVFRSENNLFLNIISYFLAFVKYFLSIWIMLSWVLVPRVEFREKYGEEARPLNPRKNRIWGVFLG